MNKLTPKQILRNLDNGYLMNRQEQADAAQYIRQLQESNQVMAEMVLLQTEELVVMRRKVSERGNHGQD